MTDRRTIEQRLPAHETAETSFGFRWGPLTVERTCSDDRYHIITIRTPHRVLEVAVSPTGRAIRTNQKAAPKKHGCAGCGFPHADDYKDCVWLKNPY